MEACRLGKPSAVVVLLEQTHQTRRQASALSCKLIYLQPPAWPSRAGLGAVLASALTDGSSCAISPPFARTNQCCSGNQHLMVCGTEQQRCPPPCSGPAQPSERVAEVALGGKP